ncbi:uncharacterized protein LOC128304029 [Anopheles moucheti]|uniref:uncharacterized protein LOC128304029 n=1 Tax=Anopheles moucheti TaxID=186751 RepID=UPI0022F13787|nr:uncharacterized protein LOC128304029 [Anopheles moucheti]XP_052897112.1 uncharacterized protein LOC128304029 [Anopheles moucheti]
MASARAFAIFNENKANENQIAGKNIQSLKGSEPRSSSAVALKDLTNKNKTHRTIVHQDGKGKGSHKQEKKIKSATSSILHTIGLDKEKAAPRKPSRSSYDVFSPQHAEYAWGQAACLPDDLLERMIDCNGVPYEVKRKPLSMVRPDLRDLPDLDVYPPAVHEFMKEQTLKPLDLPDLPLAEIPPFDLIF